MVKTAGLPNITGTTRPIPYSTAADFTGAFYTDTKTKSTPEAGGVNRGIVTFDASRCSSVYGNSNTVQPPSIVLIPQIRF